MGLFDDWTNIFDTGDGDGLLDTAGDLYGAYESAVGSDNSGGGLVSVNSPMMTDGGQMVQAGLPGAMVAGGIWLGSFLARAFGRGASAAVFTAANGIRVRMTQLWPLVRRYGAEAVAGGLGISVGALGTLLAQPSAIHGRAGKRGKGRGVTSRDVKTTRRTLRTIKKLYAMMPTRAGSSRYSSYRPRRRYR